VTSKAIQGFTFIELIITLSVVSILLAYGVPGYHQFRLNQNMTTAINQLSATINFARSKSIIEASHVIACPSTSYTACDGDGNWHGGWMIFADHNRNRSFDGGDTMILNEMPMTDGIQAISSIHRKKVRFNSWGAAPGTNVTIRFCDQRGAAHGKALIISNVGRPRVQQQINRC